MTSKQKNDYDKILLKNFKNEDLWKGFALKNPSASRSLAMLFIEKNQPKNLEKLFLQTPQPQKFRLFVHCTSLILNEKEKLPQKWFKPPLCHNFSEQDVSYWLQETAHYLAFEKSFDFLDQVAPSWRTSKNFTPNLVAMFCRTPFTKLRSFISTHPEFFPQFQAFEEKINEKTQVLNEDNLPEYFALKQKNSLLKSLSPLLKKAKNSPPKAL